MRCERSLNEPEISFQRLNTIFVDILSTKRNAKFSFALLGGGGVNTFFYFKSNILMQLFRLSIRNLVENWSFCH